MNFVFVLIIAFLPLLGFAQEGSGSNEMAVDPTVQDEAALQELEANRNARQERLEVITEVVGPVSEENSSENFTPADLLKTESLTRMEKILKDAKMSQYPPELIRGKVLDAFKGHALEGYVRSSPNLQNFFVDIIRDEKALISAIRIFKDKSRLKIYLYFWIGIMFAAYYTKKLFISKYWKGATRGFAGILFSLTISTITLSTFCLIFSEEMKPIIAIVKKHI